ncbi:short-chain dehydrogenase [Paramagnetospirillum kuznetsovii]|uniref:Short-chain dehydrogenase n=1 Tax=Paramagnetospirillum kuznetsovii TaxID=2053833 RepID=A0A364NWN0_9PROT|nr:SDR family oxidoreductase [Paramagnetospirillum kuznetsovii]RAU21315.1 short-chain dehydrogenase [Paramagnetospirillum kuznetsovii]
MNDYAVITGGARGIGAAIARKLRSDGLRVIVVDRDSPATDTADEFLQLDLADAPNLTAGLERIILGRRVTRLVNNAGIVMPASLEDADPDSFGRVVDVNLIAPMLCAKAVLPAMKAAHYGRIVNISSRAALGKELRTAYSATKAGLIGMSKTWALELAPYGITVNVVGPGPINTELFAKVNPAGDARTQAIMNAIPVKRLGTPEDVAQAVAFFCAEGSGFVTGQVLYVCGGLTIGSA